MGIRISEMEEATSFTEEDYVPIVSSGTNKKALGQKIKDFIAGFFATKTGDNISDKATFRSAIEISATNTPFDNTGTGMSAENVQAGIVELSGNRALKDGSNIANPSAFRQNIGIGYTLINTYTSNGQTLSHNLSNYSKILIVAYFTNTSNVTYVVGSLLIPTSEVIDNHPIVCFNDGTLRKGQLNFKTTYATTENFGNITALKVYGGN